MRHAWHLFNLAMVLHAIAAFRADTTTGITLHAVAALGFGIAARMTRPKQPPTLR
jgi:hypothetical protein